MRTVKKVHKALQYKIANLLTYTPLPNPSLSDLNPFLLLNHHGHQFYEPYNKGLPFGPHPHRGMETVTFVFDGDVMHKDSNKNETVIYPGGVQFMSAGRGIIHAEQSSEAFKQVGGDLEIVQLWLNMRAKDKMSAPFYTNFQANELPSYQENGTEIKVLSGDWKGTKGAFETNMGVHLYTMYMLENSRLITRVSNERTILFYVLKGEVKVNGTTAKKMNLIEFNNDLEEVLIEAKTNSIVIFGHSQVLKEPLVSQGPFVMNSEAEIEQAYEDYRNGVFGEWNF